MRVIKVVAILLCSVLLCSSCQSGQSANWKKINAIVEANEVSNASAEVIIQVIDLLPDDGITITNEPFIYYEFVNRAARETIHFEKDNELAEPIVKWILNALDLNGRSDEIYTYLYSMLDSENEHIKYFYLYKHFIIPPHRAIFSPSSFIGQFDNYLNDWVFPYMIPNNNVLAQQFVDMLAEYSVNDKFVGLLVYNDFIKLLQDDMIDTWFGMYPMPTLLGKLDTIASYTQIPSNDHRIANFIDRMLPYARDYEKQQSYFMFISSKDINDANGVGLSEMSEFEKAFLEELSKDLDLGDIVLDKPINVPTGILPQDKRADRIIAEMQDDGYAVSVNDLNQIEPYSIQAGAMDGTVYRVWKLVEASTSLKAVPFEVARYLICYDYEYIPTAYGYSGTTGALVDGQIVSHETYTSVSELRGTLSVYDRRAGTIVGEIHVLYDKFPSSIPSVQGKPVYGPDPTLEVVNQNSFYYDMTMPYVEWLSELLRD